MQVIIRKKYTTKQKINVVKRNMSSYLFFQRTILLQRYLFFFTNQLNVHSYNPDIANKKILTVYACHTNNESKYKTSINNLKYFNYSTNDVVVVNSSNEMFSGQLKEAFKGEYKAYFEIPNDNYSDYGKFIYALKNLNYLDYDFVVFMNDSIIIRNKINHFYNLMIKKNVELYGYNDSTQGRYHYQTYLFGLRADAVRKFVEYFDSIKSLLNNYDDLVSTIELKLTDIFDNSRDCFLKIGNLPVNQGQNIYFTNDFLYNILFRKGLLPFTKVKRIG